MLEVIYVVRHGFRSSWLVDPSTGSYESQLRSPTGLATDPALTSHGVKQARELGAHLTTIQPAIERVYSSPYYRCLQTVEPYVRLRGSFAVRLETGIAEWYGSAPFEQPISAAPELLDSLFPGLLDLSYRPTVRPLRNGESIDQLYDRVARAVDAIIKQCDAEGVRVVLLCAHAAVIIALGRVLTGDMPQDVGKDDFRCFTCGLSKYRRRAGLGGASRTREEKSSEQNRTSSDASPSWRIFMGVAGAWYSELNSDCSFLSSGEERGWRFSGDESFTEPPSGKSKDTRL